MLAEGINLGIRGVQKQFSRRGNQFSLNLSMGNPGKIKPRTLKLFDFEHQRAFNIVTNYSQFAGYHPDNYPALGINSDQVAILASPFDEYIKDYFSGNCMLGAVFYDLKQGNLDELNRAIRIIKAIQLLRTPFLVFGNEGDRGRVEGHDCEFYSSISDWALRERLSDIKGNWENDVSCLKQVLDRSWSFLLSLQAIDDYAAAHSQSVAAIACLVGEKLGLTQLEMELLMMGAVFYDLGKMTLSENILRNPGRLTEAEFAEVKQHPKRGDAIVAPFIENFGWNLQHSIHQMIKYHHRSYDKQKGYPDFEMDLGDISLLTYILSGCDAFDAMLTKRPYADKEFTLDDKKEDIRNNREKQFHPKVADALLGLLDEGVSIQAEMGISATTSVMPPEIERLSRLANIGTLAAGVAHEMNNALAVVKNYMSFAQQGLATLQEITKYKFDQDGSIVPLVAQIDEDLRIAEQPLENIISLSKSMLNLGRENIRRDRFSPNDAIIKTEALVRPRYKCKYVSLRLVLGTEVPDLLGNQQGFQQIILDLLINAEHATSQGGEVIITSEREGGMIRIKVSDTGHGIPDEIKAKIFEPFFTTKSQEQGTGLGLFIVKREMEKMGGSVDFVSEVGKGTTFILEFPPYKEV